MLLLLQLLKIFNSNSYVMLTLHTNPDPYIKIRM